MELNCYEFQDYHQKHYQIKKLFINILLKKGKKTNSENIFKNILINLKKITKQKPFFILLKCIKNLSPKIKIINLMNTRKRKGKKRNNNKRNKSSFLFFLNNDKQIKMSIKWLILNSNLKNIANEIIYTFNKKSKTINFKKQYYKDIQKLKFNIYF